MKNISLVRFLDLLNERRAAYGLRSLDLQPVTFVHDIAPEPKMTLDILYELTQKLNIKITRNSLRSDFLSPYLRFNLQDIYEAFQRLVAERMHQRHRKIWYTVAYALAAVTLYELFVEIAVLQVILLACITSGIFQYLQGSSS
ncbi:hypothetical protein [Tumebacillus permanentifrigoris]|uniref:Uncharacterized protein n=1 Tax=Tumebacillus permanentifrigoris TaxID=378543 RepID=A0A316DDP2_9BACL|nr:hypothetical protein [Tumebacillus permanentifrigoris]PWK14910.1 hypothetical protein C7459_104112 [Tumebacillus permanentifrigoris]